VLVDKPAGMTSHDVVQQVRRRVGAQAAGHTGTLDPFATGLLVVLVGRATRLARFVEAESKVYLASARLGVQTATDDPTGDVIASTSTLVSEVRVHQALEGFLGTQLQRPPQFSAKHVAGERSYRKARRGETVELAEASVTVHRIDLVAYQPPDLTFRATVSSGTYLRALARDLGNRLGVGAHLTSLRCEAIGSHRIEHAVSLEQLGPASVLPPQYVIGHLPAVRLDPTGRQAITHGRAVADSDTTDPQRSGEPVALFWDDELVGVARAEDGWLRPAVVLAAP
jgi:tRNA pseudouridine55 synthase